jgi:hypothetical protein
MDKEIVDRFDKIEKIMQEDIERYSKSLSCLLSQISNIRDLEISEVNASDKGEIVNSMDKSCISPYFISRDVYRFDIPVKGNVREVKDSEERAYFIRNGNGDTFTSFTIKLKNKLN